MKIDADVESVLTRSTVDGSLLFLPPEQLDRALYVKVNKALEAIGGKWNRKQKAHVFDYDPADAVDQIILTGEFIDPKKEFQFFETPTELAETLVSMAAIETTDRVLEPSAGQGRIADFVRQYVEPICVELNPDNAEELRAKGYNVIESDFLGYNETVDVIVANPPFSKQQDIDHVNHMLDLARKRVVSVMSASVLFRENRKTVEFRDRIESLGGTFEELPEGAFKASGTNVRACVVVVGL